MGTISNTIILLDLIQTGITISLEVQEAFRRAESENRNITQDEIKEAASENEDLYADVMLNLQSGGRNPPPKDPE